MAFPYLCIDEVELSGCKCDVISVNQSTQVHVSFSPIFDAMISAVEEPAHTSLNLQFYCYGAVDIDAAHVAKTYTTEFSNISRRELIHEA